MKFDPVKSDVHPSDCNCGLCESVEPAKWMEVLSIMRDVFLLLTIFAAGYLALLAQVTIECEKCSLF